MNKITIILVAWMCCLEPARSDEGFELLILHNNDLHAHFEEYGSSMDGKKIGGFGRTLTILKKARKAAEEGKGPPVLYLNAGDTFTGTVWFSVHKWKIASDFMNLLAPDAMCLGNHEFDNGIDGLLPFIKNLSFPIVTANLDLKYEPDLQASKLSPSVVLERGGVKIGVIGYLTPDTKQLGSIGKLIITDEVEAIKKESELLKEKGVNVIIALGHSGFLTDKKIAKEVPLVDLVIGGHTNTFLWNGQAPDREKPEGPYPTVITQKSGKRVPVVQAFAYTKYIGSLKVTFDAGGNLVSYKGQPMFIDEDVPQDPAALSLLEVYRPEVMQLNEAIVGRSKVYLSGERCRMEECNFGNIITDAMVAYKVAAYNGPFWTDSSIAVINSGSIRSGVNVTATGGNVTKGALLGAFPFLQKLVTVTLKGSDLIDTLEIGVRSDGRTSRGEFLQVAGLHVVYDLSEPIGHRVKSVQARCTQCSIPVYEDVKPNMHYNVTATAFLSSGGDGHVVLHKRGIRYYVEDVIDFDCLVNYVAERPLIYPDVEGRIRTSGESVRTSNAHSFNMNVIHLVVVSFSLLCIYSY